MTDSNRRHPACKAGALPTELIARGSGGSPLILAEARRPEQSAAKTERVCPPETWQTPPAKEDVVTSPNEPNAPATRR
jgi:hypothetical protein